jgi:hypothetical protein
MNVRFSSPLNDWSSFLEMATGEAEKMPKRTSGKMAMAKFKEFGII